MVRKNEQKTKEYILENMFNMFDKTENVKCVKSCRKEFFTFIKG